jgi:hypothetical protein
MLQSMNAAAIVSNARSLHHSAITTAIALELVAPVEGRTWTACCCRCLDRADPSGDAPAHRLAFDRGAQWPGGCMRCAAHGEDVLVAAL